MKPIVPTTNQLARNSISGILRSIIVGIIFLIVYPIYINKLGAETFGVWVMINVIIGWGQLGNLSVPQALMKFVSGSAAKGDKEEMIEYVSSALTIIFISGIIITILLFFTKNVLGKFLHVPATLEPQMPFFIFLAGLVVLVSFLAQNINSILSGIGRMDLANMNEVIGVAFNAIISIILILKGYGIWALLVGSILNFLAILFLGFFLSISKLRYIPYKIDSIKKERMKEIIRFGGTLAMGLVFALFIEPFNRFILGQYVSLSAATTYDVASKVGLQLRNIGESGLRPIMPQISTYNTIKKESQILVLNKTAINYILVFVFPFFLIMFFSARSLLPLWMGSGVLPNLNMNIKILLAGYFLNLLVVPLYYTFMGITKVRICLWMHIIQSIVNCSFAIILIRIFPIPLSVSISISLGFMLSAIYGLRVFFQIFRVSNPYAFFKEGTYFFFLSILIFFPLSFINEKLVLLVIGIILILTVHLYLAEKVKLVNTRNFILRLKEGRLHGEK